MIMLAAFIGGPFVGAIAGGLGASLADFISGWYTWVIPTLIIKGIEGFLAGWIGQNGFSRKVLGWLIGGCELVTGYLLGGPGGDTKRTLALNTVVRNLGLALLISGSQFSGVGAEIVVIAFAFVMYAVAAIATNSWYKEFLKPI